MITSDLPKKEPLFSLEQVPNDIHNVIFTKIQKEKLALGELVFLENLQRDGRIIDGKVRLSKDEHGDPRFEVFEKKQVLDLVKVDFVLSKPLTKENKEDLLAEKLVEVETPQGQKLWLQYDKELHTIINRTTRDLSVITEIGGYKLTDREKLAWGAGDKLPTKVFYDDYTGSYFAASIRKTEDGKGVEYHDYKSLKNIDKDQIQQLIKKYNQSPDIIAATAGVTNAIKTGPTNTAELSNTSTKKTIEVNTVHDNDARFVNYTNNKDYEGLKRLAAEGYKPEKELIDRTVNQLKLTTDEKKAVMMAIGNESQKNTLTYKPDDLVILTLNNKPYKVLELSDSGNKALLVDSQNKRIGVSIEDVRYMSKQEKGMFLGSSKKITKQKDQSLQI